MALPTLTDIKRQWNWALWDLLFFLAVLAVIGSGITASILLIPVISISLAFAFLPQIMAIAIALLPLIACTALLWQFIENNWHSMTFLDIQERPSIKENSMTEGQVRIMQYTAAHLIRALLWVIGNISRNCNLNKEESETLLGCLFLFYLVPVGLTAIGLGIYLSVMILPTLVPAVAALTGVPFVVAGLFGTLAAVVSVMLTYQLLILPMRLFALYLQFRLWQEEEHYKDLLFHIFQTLVTLSGMALAAYTSYLIFPLIVNSLLPFLPHATAVFTAVVISVSLLTLMMTTLPSVIAFLGSGLRMVADKGKNEPSDLTIFFKTWEGRLREWLSGPLVTPIRLELDQEYANAANFIPSSSGERSLSYNSSLDGEDDLDLGGNSTNKSSHTSIAPGSHGAY